MYMHITSKDIYSSNTKETTFKANCEKCQSKIKRNVKGGATQKEIVKLRSKVSRLRYDCREKEKPFKILKKDFIESRIEGSSYI